jgi:hypothetical protein
MKKRILFLMLNMAYVSFAQVTLIPDANFEQRLIDMGYDVGPIDGSVPTANISGVTSLVVPLSNISDMTGIEDFIALENLDCIGNPITSLDLSSNTALIDLYTGNNTISTLIVSNNLNLETLVCTGHQLSSLNLANNTALKTLTCNTGILSSLDLSSNTALESLNCDNNVLTSLDLKNSNNNLLTTMSAINNSMTCVQVDDESAANSGSGVYGGWTVDNSVTYSESCISCPEMNILGNSISIVTGDNTPDVSDDTDYGMVNFGEFLDRTFTIVNSGTQDLNLSGIPLVQITNSTDFTIITPPNALILANGGSTTFTVRYEPSMVGTINTGILSIDNDDCEENPYVFHVLGESQSALGLINSELNDSDVSIIPNPNDGKFVLQYSGMADLTDLKLYDITGKFISKIEMDNFQSEKEIRLIQQRGIYFLEINARKQRLVRKLVIF